ncbi:voltage-gated sodium channel [Sinosporangium album]|uniref:Voltage-gated sodium channel n=1 Tax=Sinosporangium album TaxID=504805 RepID=A0A1G7TY12_9ACTN|nr:ion transporter [Sinosporangium album]SDG40192.1 voltage-gated sodium channel [Sinosporangium album]
MPSRQQLRQLLEHRFTQRAVVTVIVINAVTIGCETSAYLMEHVGTLLHAIDRIALAIFTVELAVRLYAYGRAFWSDPWNWFDAIIVLVALVPASGPTSILRSLRILRALRLVSAVPSMRRVVGALLTAMPGMASIIGLLTLLIYIAAVVATKLFGEIVPDRFDELPRSLFTLFQIMTGDDWGSVAQEVMRHKPWAWIFFIAYILMSTFVALNLFIAVVVNAMDDAESSPAEARAEADIHELREELAAVNAKLDKLLARQAGDTASAQTVPHGPVPRGPVPHGPVPHGRQGSTH